MMMKYKTLASSHSCLRVILISSILVTTLQPLAWLALAQTLPSVLQNLPSSSATSEPSASSPRSHDFASTHPTRLASMLITGEPLHVSSTAHRMQTLSTTPAMHYQHRRQQQQQQQTPPKSLKFTLTAGKYWKFNIKTNSLQTSQKEKELRLHRNVSAGNYIIDDDGWFQYNHQQQQLFAWPGLNVKPATYYFVLLPSALDYEADGENVINVGDVVANIVVELIRPFVGGSGASSKLDVDQLIDYKLSLDNLHRHSSYPLLLTQIVSIFDLLSRATNSDQNSSIPPQSTQTIATTTTTHSTVTTSTPQSSVSTNFIAAAIQQNKQARLAGKFTEFLLINSSAAQDGEFFSIAWTIQPTLINNTIVPITECRLSMINETVSRLSSRSILYPVVDDKFVISYALEGPLVNSQAIIPTERGNFALKLSLHNACRNKRVIDELGVTSVTGFPMDIDDKDNNVPVSTASLQSSSSTETPSTSVGSDVIVIPEQTDKQEAGRDREHAVEQPIQVATETHPAVLVTEITPASTPAIGSTESSLGPSSTSSSAGSSSQTFFSDPTPPAPTTTEASNTISASPTVHLSTNWPLPSESQQHPTPDPLLHIQTSIRRALGTSVLPPPTTSEREQQQQQQRSPSPQPPPKLQPQAKSFENFLDSSSDIIMNSTISLIDAMTGVHSAPNTSILVEPPTTTTTTTKTNSINASIPNSVPAISKSGQESSLNDDLIGILNEITELMVSIAVPLAVVLGIVLIVSILIAICNLCMKKRKSKQFEVSDRFKFRYGSERKGFLKKSSKPVILEADQKSLSMGGTPRHQPLVKPKNDGDKRKNAPYNKHTTNNNSSGSDFFAMSLLSSGGNPESGASGGHSGHCGTTDSGDCGGAGQ